MIFRGSNTTTVRSEKRPRTTPEPMARSSVPSLRVDSAIIFVGSTPGIPCTPAAVLVAPGEWKAEREVENAEAEAAKMANACGCDMPALV